MMHTPLQRLMSVTQQLTPRLCRAASTHSAPSPFTSSKPQATSSTAGHVSAPAGALQQEIISDPKEQAAKLAARQLLPFNYGRALESTGTQTLKAVGYPTAAQQKSGKPVPYLFRTLDLNGKRFLKNRIIVSPMCTYSADDGFLNDWHLAHLGQYALGGAGMVIVEATAVAFEGRISPTDSGLWKDAQAEPLKRIVALLHSQDCRAGIQLAHAGRKASTIPPFHLPRGQPTAEAVDHTLGGWPQDVIAPSTTRFADDYWTPAEMTLTQIATLKQQFVASARRARDAGFDYIEVHGAHGYLITEFLSSTSNKRTDAYGGSFDNRTRLLREIVTLVRAEFSGVLGVRLTCDEWRGAEGWQMADTLKLVSQLDSLNVDLIDCSSGGNSVTQKIIVKPGYQVHFAEAVKQALPHRLIAAVGLITEAQQAETILASGQADVIMIAREFLRNPHWALQAAKQLGFDIEWSPQYQRAKPSAGQSPAIPSSGQRS